MSVPIGVVIPSIVAAHALDWCLKRVFAFTPVPSRVIVIANGPEVVPVASRWEERGIQVLIPGYNLGVAASWNRGARLCFAAGDEMVAFLNDDICVTTRDTLGQLWDRRGTRSVFLLGPHGYSAFCLPRVVWDEIGSFDEGYWPGYYEDNDYAARCAQAGISQETISLVVDHEGSLSLRSDPTLAEIVRVFTARNKRRYDERWGR